MEQLDKETLKRLYVEENKSTHEIASILGYSSVTIAYRCREYGIDLKCQRKKRREIDKEVLKKLYVRESKALTEISKILDCSSFTIASRCREYGIDLKRQGKKRKEIDKKVLKKLYVREGKTLTEISKILDCSYAKVRESCLEYGIPLRTARKKRGRKLNAKENTH